MTGTGVAERTAASSRTRLPALEPVSAECAVCGIHLQQLPGTDIAAGLREFRTHHPMTSAVPHLRRTPPGWREPLSGPGALSQ